LWDVEHERVVTKVVGHDSYINHISWMPNQPILAAASADSTISIWNMQERRQITSLESHASPIEGVSFSAGGVLLASTAERDNMIHGAVRLWRTDTWQQLIILKELGSAGGALAFHPALPLLATRCHGNPEKTSMNHTSSSIRIWDLDFETFLSNPPFTDEFNRMEADGHFASE
jgi:WD40 repeat protein